MEVNDAQHPPLSSWALCPGSIVPLTPERADGWILGTIPRMTVVFGLRPVRFCAEAAE